MKNTFMPDATPRWTIRASPRPPAKRNSAPATRRSRMTPKHARMEKLYRQHILKEPKPEPRVDSFRLALSLRPLRKQKPSRRKRKKFSAISKTQPQRTRRVTEEVFSVTLKFLRFISSVGELLPISLCSSAASVVRICYALPSYIDGFRCACRLCRRTQTCHVEERYRGGAERAPDVAVYSEQRLGQCGTPSFAYVRRRDC